MPASRIIIVEDEAIIAKDLETRLKRNHYLVVAHATNGEDAIRLAIELKPDLILMDIKLIGAIDGIEAANRIQGQVDIPIIYLTALEDDETLSRAKVTGPFGYLIKPVEARELFGAIEIAIYKHHMEFEQNKQLQRTKTMHQIDQAIISNHDLHQTLVEVLSQICSQLGMDAAAVMLLNQNSQTLEYFAFQGFHQPLGLTYGQRLGEGLAGQAAITNKLVHVADLQNVEARDRPSWISIENFITYFALPLYCKGKLKGVLELFHRQVRVVDQEWLDFLEILAAQTAIALDNASMFGELLEVNMELTQAYNATIKGWSAALELRDLETEGHSQRVTDMTVALANAMHIPSGEIEHIRRGALLHDIGKMGIPDSILFKPGPLNSQEWEVMKKHPQYAYNLLASIPFLRPALDIPYCHHEKWDGSGYPQGLKGEQIPLAARIFAVVDVWDALLSERPYRSTWPESKVLEYIREQAGKHFDPQVVDLFIELRNKKSFSLISDAGTAVDFTIKTSRN